MELPTGYEYIETKNNHFMIRKEGEPREIVLCKIFPKFKEIDVRLLCSRKNMNVLLHLVEKKALSLDYMRVSVICIGDENLLNLYKTFGFNLISEKPIIMGQLSIYTMKKNI